MRNLYINLIWMKTHMKTPVDIKTYFTIIWCVWKIPTCPLNLWNLTDIILTAVNGSQPESRDQPNGEIKNNLQKTGLSSPLYSPLRQKLNRYIYNSFFKNVIRELKVTYYKLRVEEGKHSTDSANELSDLHTTHTQATEVRWGARFSGHWVVTSMSA